MNESINSDQLKTESTNLLLESNVLLARQTIFNRNNEVYGFELLYRGKRFDVSRSGDGLGTTGELLNNIFTCVVEGNIASGKPLFINVDQHFIESPSFFPSQSDNIVLEILETVPATPSILKKIKELRRKGFEFALDDYIFEEERQPFLPLVSLIKIDLLGCPWETIKKGLPALKQHSVTLLAEKVEDFDMFVQCRELGFSLFQGYYLERPKLVHGVKVSASKQVTLKLLCEISRPDITVNEVAQIIVCDPRLALKMMLLVNSSIFTFVRKIQDIKEAVVMLGMEAVKRWTMILLLVSESESPVEIFRVLLARAKALELFAAKVAPQHQSEFFMLGLFSGLDAVLGIKMEKVTEIIPLSQELESALNEETGMMGRSLQTLKQIEAYDIDIDKSNVQAFISLNGTYWQGLFWADELMETVVGN
jgi:EAL and modified HD-GYP domain-containing signal transduction protein